MKKTKNNYGVFNDDGLHGRYTSFEAAESKAKELESSDRDSDFHVRKLITVNGQRCWSMYF